jgi:hypothetical protein
MARAATITANLRAGIKKLRRRVIFLMDALDTARSSKHSTSHALSAALLYFATVIIKDGSSIKSFAVKAREACEVWNGDDQTTSIRAVFAACNEVKDRSYPPSTATQLWRRRR